MLKEYLEQVYACYNTAEFIKSDPLEIVREYDVAREREVVALLTSSLAYGRVASIKNSVRELMNRLEGCPRRFLEKSDRKQIRRVCRSFRHRFTGPEKMADLLTGTKRVITDYGDLESCFCSHIRTAEANLVGAVSRFVRDLAGEKLGIPHLLPSPERGSACKRLWLFLRWMVRNDCVDPGGWDRVDRSGLIVPLDAHMSRICRELKLTERAQSDLKAAVEATQSFQTLCPDDPVKYDFALTRVAMFEGMDEIRNWEKRVPGKGL